MKKIQLLFTIIFAAGNLLAQQEDIKSEKVADSDTVTIKTDVFTDNRDEKVYKTVKIGDQIWMAENLAFKTDSGCWAYDNDENNVSKYGYLYSWETAKKVCPSAWHLPSDAEWTTLTAYLGGEEVGGKKLKSSSAWAIEGLTNYATNMSGFNALPAGYRLSNNNSFFNINLSSNLWTSTPLHSKYAWCYNLSGYTGNVNHVGFDRTHGFSVRCIQD